MTGRTDAPAPLAVTIGEPSGVGADVTLAAYAARRDRPLPTFFLLADPAMVASRAKRLGLGIPLAEIGAPEDATAHFGAALPVLPLINRHSETPGRIDPLNALGTIAAMAPLLGLLGTVLGMIDIFSAFTGSGMTTNASVLAGGISKALITTAAGLMVGIPAVFFHRFLQRRIDELVVGMEQEAIKLVEVVQGDRDVDLSRSKA